MQQKGKSRPTIVEGQEVRMNGESPHMSALIPIAPHAIGSETVNTVNARNLYAYLNIKGDYSLWIRRAIKRANLIENMDFIVYYQVVENSKGGRPAAEHHLTLDAAKHIAMMSSADKGHEARAYFIACEKATLGLVPIPQVKNPANQLMIDAVVRIDGLEQELQQQQAQLMTHQQAMLAMQAQQIEALQRSLDADIKADRAEVKADLALDEAHRMTLEGFLAKNGLLPKFPTNQRTRIVHWLIDYCQRYGLTIRKIPVVGKPWPDENGYLLAALAAWLHYEQTKPWQVRLLDDTGRESA